MSYGLFGSLPGKLRLTRASGITRESTLIFRSGISMALSEISTLTGLLPAKTRDSGGLGAGSRQFSARTGEFSEFALFRAVFR